MIQTLLLPNRNEALQVLGLSTQAFNSEPALLGHLVYGCMCLLGLISQICLLLRGSGISVLWNSCQ